MLDKISKLCEPIYSIIKDKAESLYALMVGEPSFDSTTSKPSEKKSEEHLVLLNSKARVSDSPDAPVTEGLSGDLSTQNVPKSTPERGRAKLESDEEWDEFFKLQNNPSTNTTNQKPFSPKKGETQYRGKDIVGKIADQIKSEISEGMKNNIIGSIMIKEGKREGNVVYPSVRVVLNASKEGVDIAKLLGGYCLKRFNKRVLAYIR